MWAQDNFNAKLYLNTKYEFKNILPLSNTYRLGISKIFK